MTRAAPSPIAQFLRRVVEDGKVRELPDQDLLQRFHARQDHAAFQSLLRRHGPMVLDVCRGVLGDGPDAEDAFQATFLILAQKAGSIRKGPSLGSWLHGVARRTALKARAQSAVRQKHEARVPERQAAQADDLSWREVRQVLHDELAGIPERYREPLVLCYLEGATHQRAAARLGLAERTVRERLERGRELLRLRLVRRGFGFAAILAVAAWPAADVEAAVPAALVDSTVQAATTVTVGAVASAASGKVAALAQGVLTSMSHSKLKSLKITTAVLVAAALLVSGIGTFSMRALQARPAGRAALRQSDVTPQPIGIADVASARQRPDLSNTQFPVDAKTDVQKLHGTYEKPTDPVEQKSNESTPDVRSLKGHTGAVYFAAFSTSGETLVTASKGIHFSNPTAPRGPDEVIIWDVAAQGAKHKIPFKGAIWSMNLSADAKAVAVGTSDSIVLLDAETGKTMRTLEGPWALSTGPFCLAFAPDGKILASGGSARDNMVRLWDVQTGKLTATLRGHEDAVVGLSFAPDGKTLASTGGQYDTTVRYWDVATGQLRRTVNRAQEHSKDGTEAVDGDWQTWPAAFSPDGQILARGRGAEVKFWDVRTGEVTDRLIEGPHLCDRTVQSLAFSPDGKRLAVGRTSGEIDVRETRQSDGKHGWRIGDLKQTFNEGPSDAVMTLAFSRSGELLASGDADGRVRIWKINKQ
jgi:RNA polymerase sigma factor (sigma-70 family)